MLSFYIPVEVSLKVVVEIASVAPGVSDDAKNTKYAYLLALKMKSNFLY